MNNKLSLSQQKIAGMIQHYVSTQNSFIDKNGGNTFFDLVKTLDNMMTFRKKPLNSKK